MAWYYVVNDKRIGPVEVTDLCGLIDGGTLTEATLVWTRGMAQWQPVRIALKGAYTPPDETVPRRFHPKRTWHYVLPAGRFGPVHGSTMDVLYHEGTVTNDTYVWTKGMAQWQRLGSLLPVPAAGASPTSSPASAGDGSVITAPESEGGSDASAGNDEAPPIETCAGCGRFYNREEMLAYNDQFVCVPCKPEFFQREREGFDQRPSLPFAGFWIRCFARIFDILVVNVMLYGFAIIAINLIISGVTPYLSNPTTGQLLLVVFAAILSITIPMAYETYFIGRHGATPGKMIVDIQVLRSDGSPVSYGRALARFFTALMSQLFCFLGCLPAAFDREKCGVHDYICDTRVILK